MLRPQAPPPERYIDTDDSNAARIAAAKTTLGDRLFIPGHHYQRGEVLSWPDASGHSFRPSQPAQAPAACRSLNTWSERHRISLARQITRTS